MPNNEGNLRASNPGGSVPKTEPRVHIITYSGACLPACVPPMRATALSASCSSRMKAVVVGNHPDAAVDHLGIVRHQHGGDLRRHALVELALAECHQAVMRPDDVGS